MRVLCLVFLEYSLLRNETLNSQGGGDVIFKFAGVSYAPPKCVDPLVKGKGFVVAGDIISPIEHDSAWTT